MVCFASLLVQPIADRLTPYNVTSLQSLLDTARHFIPMSQMRRLLAQMAANKLNVLHWHFSDAVAFSLDLGSDGKGAGRGKERSGSDLEHDEDFDGPEVDLSRLAGEGALRVGGRRVAYSRADAEEIVALASNLSIRVVPELDMPAHVASWHGGAVRLLLSCRLPPFACLPAYLHACLPACMQACMHACHRLTTISC